MQPLDTISPALSYVREYVNRLYGDRVTSLQLYGSYARNEAREDSDVDLLLVLEDDVNRYEENWNLSDLVLEVLKRYSLFVSFVILSKNEFQQADWPLLVSIENEAIPL